MKNINENLVKDGQKGEDNQIIMMIKNGKWIYWLCNSKKQHNSALDINGDVGFSCGFLCTDVIIIFLCEISHEKIL